MNAQANIATKPNMVIIAQVEATPIIVLTDKQKFSEFYEAMRAECDAHVPDLTTEKGRKEIASLAYKVARTKTAIDAAGKQLNEEARSRINAVDEARRVIREQLDSLKDEVRAPLTAWEAAEEDRQETAAQELSAMREMQRVDLGDDAESVLDRINILAAMTIDPAVHQGAAELAENTRQASIDVLRTAHARLVREEDERAELERLRAANAAREAQEREERDAREAKERTEVAAKAEAERVAAAAKAHAEQIERAAREAEERAKQEAEEKAAAEASRRQQEHDDALATERRRAEEAEADAKAERDRAAKEEAGRKAEAEREAAELARRESDRAHRAKIMGAAKAAIITCGADEPTAKAIVLAIVGKNVPYVSIQF